MEDWKEGESEDELKMRILKDLKVNGLVQEDMNVIHHLDRDIPDVTKDSLVIPIKLNKDGSFSANSSAVSLERMQKLSEHVTHKIQAIGKEILDGNVAINPYEKGTQTGCDYCPYQGICGFDGKIPGYGYRRLDKMQPQDVWEKIEQEAAEYGR